MIHTTLIGFVGKDIEDRFMPNGTKVRSFPICVEEDFWVSYSVFGDKLDKILPHIKKGSAICVHGSIRKPTIYQTNKGETRVNFSVIVDSINFLPKRKDKDEELKVYSKPKNESGPSPYDNMELPF